MYPRIENSVRWSAHPESRTDQEEVTKPGEAGPSSAGAGPSQECASPCYSDASDQALPPGLLRATPPRPLFSRTPSPARNAIAGAQIDGVEFGQPVHHAAPAVGDGHGDGRVSPASWCLWCRLLLVAPQRQHGDVAGRRRRRFADRRVPRVSLAVSTRRRGGEVNEHDSPRNRRISPRLHWGQRDAPSGHEGCVGCGKRVGRFESP